jgi:SAM-dependent methyltransferase
MTTMDPGPDTTATAAAYFEDFPERYARFNELRDRLMPATYDWLRAHLPGGGRALDLGCGEGRSTALLAERYDEVLAVDLSAAMLRLARERHAALNVRYEERGVLDVTPEADGRFDAVLSVNVLHHVAPLATVFGHVRGLLAPGGHLAVADIVNPGGWGRDAGWHVDQAFATARGFYHLAGDDPEAAVDVLRLALHPRWLEMMVTDIPPSRAEFHRHAGEAFPGADFHDGLHAVVCAVAWQAPT